MSEKLNLKGNSDELVYYKTLPTGKKIGRTRVKNGEQELYYVSETEEHILSENQVKEFQLDKFGEHIPYMDGHLTIINNYFFDFWGYFLGAEGTALFAHLKRYAYGNKDFCYPSVDLISLKMGKNPVTVRNYMKLLEKYGFIWKINVRNKTRDYTEESPIFKIRKKVPLLPEELIYGNPLIEIDNDEEPYMKKALKKEKEGLPKALRKAHDEFLESMKDESETIDIPKLIEYDAIYQDILSKGKIRKTIAKQMPQPSSAFNKIPISEEELAVTEILKDQLKDKVSKPSYETWFKNIKLKFEGPVWVILVPNDFAHDWISQRYVSLIEEILKETQGQVKRVEIRTIK
ncbi:DnaA N-terminal domain-containing protein [Bacillus licheniformis]|uniref:DnaA N-terminal domain-containing protein n=1 Tax=Bacillus TaxID=1386 RepID=UPI00046E762D|nr:MULTISPECIES: DnaA N-terminal domain-containing protein [Bacillus]ASK26215.1 hypothetical protein BSSX_p0024 [Bacillus subtilis]MCA1184594.1 helix-turn-helix domain-containing protein [Bacillus licheniformis]MCQ5304576.1 helix-turn-helix domain-containing protein [Bacillus licheniformis]MDM5287376.1 DnaA N-terminal domain-containing protein [Bacillus licheniformis]MDN5390095.1 DnaA N-terminal domain-containing protein [Bacillus sp. LB7]